MIDKLKEANERADYCRKQELAAQKTLLLVIAERDELVRKNARIVDEWNSMNDALVAVTAERDDLRLDVKAQEREHVRVENVRRLIKELRADVRDDWGIQNEIADKIEKAID